MFLFLWQPYMLQPFFRARITVKKGLQILHLCINSALKERDDRARVKEVGSGIAQSFHIDTCRIMLRRRSRLSGRGDY